MIAASYRCAGLRTEQCGSIAERKKSPARENQANRSERSAISEVARTRDGKRPFAVCFQARAQWSSPLVLLFSRGTYSILGANKTCTCDKLESRYRMEKAMNSGDSRAAAIQM